MLAALRATDETVDATGLRVAEGDVTVEGLGLDAEARDWLDGPGPIQIVHGAAEVRFHLPESVMFARNVASTEHVLALARGLGERLARLDHVSTAYVAGDRTDLVLESEADVGQRARNAYESSKLAAELKVAAAQAEGLPATIHRPSIVVGDAASGRAGSFKVLYWPLSLYARGRMRTAFGRPGCPLDVVPVNWVADAMVSLMATPASLGQTLHLCAGPERQTTLAEVGALAQAVFQARPLRFVDPDLYERWLRPWVRPLLRRFRPEVADKGGVYLPYLAANPTFDVRRRVELLALEPPRVADYFETILRFALEADFGRRPQVLDK